MSRFSQNIKYYSGYMNDIRVYDKQKYTANFKPPIRNDFTVNNIISSNECTKCNADKFYSYRRSGLKSGRMIGVIGLT